MKDSFHGENLRGARFVECDLTGVVMRGVEVARMDLDAPWLPHGGHLLVNGVDVIPYVEAELDRRFPGRSLRRASSPSELRVAWAALERSWSALLDRAAALPAGAVDTSVDGEWSFAQTLRHLVLATDMWFGAAILGNAQPYHPLALVDAGSADELDMSAFRTGTPAYAEVLEARESRVAMVREFLADVTAASLATPRTNPHNPAEPETTLSCLHVILEEEWEHHRFASRDLATLADG